MKSIPLLLRRAWQRQMRRIEVAVDGLVSWLVDNTRLFSLLPDSVEFALCLGIAAYFALHIAQPQA